MKQCAICAQSIEAVEEPAILFIGRYGHHYELCPECEAASERFIDPASPEDRKEAADIIIGDDNFSTIVSAIKEGRGIYNNITKTILFLISTNLVEVLGIFVTSLMIPNAIFLLPAQILFINLVTDSLPAFA